MKTLLFIAIAALVLSAQAQETGINYTVFNPRNFKKEYFVASNSGVVNTPYGIKVGYICFPGLYMGLRFGEGTIYNADGDHKTISSRLFSVVGGINRPLVIKNDFKIAAQLGIGYGGWWKHRWDRWTKEGYELEAGLMIAKGSWLLNMTGNVLNGKYTYGTGDFCIGLGYIF